MKQKPLWIELVNGGVANKFEFPDHQLIELNWNLTKYPGLYYNVFQHELEHTDGKYQTKDLIHDMKSKTPGLHKFMLKHPSSWTQLLPIYYDRKRKAVVYDWSAIASWVLIFGIATAMYYILRWIPSL